MAKDLVPAFLPLVGWRDEQVLVDNLHCALLDKFLRCLERRIEQCLLGFADRISKTLHIVSQILAYKPLPMAHHWQFAVNDAAAVNCIG